MEEETLESLRADLEQERDRRYDLQERLAEAEAQISALSHDLQDARDEIRDLKSEISSLSYQLDNTRDAVDSYGRERW